VTRWERFYRWLGGIGPGEVRTVPEQWELLASHVAWGLLRLGFLYRPVDGDSWLVNYRWQWRFWRGPYWAVQERMHDEWIRRMVAFYHPRLSLGCLPPGTVTRAPDAPFFYGDRYLGDPR
jgi:hypothetical protein